MNRPYITLKFAQTLDGRIAASDGSSKWISGLESRRFAHKLRANNDAIIVGAGTVLSDNPSLTTRLVRGNNPAKVIIDGRLRTPFNSKIIKNARRAKTIIITTKKAPKTQLKKLKMLGVEAVVAPSSGSGNIDLKEIIRILYKRDIKRLLVEGGRKVITSFIKSRLADKIVVIISPKILGSGIESVGDLGISGIKSALTLRLQSVKRLGDDIVYTALCQHK